MPGPNGDGGKPVKKAVEDLGCGFSESLSHPGLDRGPAAGVGVRAAKCQAGEYADGAGREERREVMAVDFIAKSGFSGLIGVPEIQGRRSGQSGQMSRWKPTPRRL